MNQANTETTRLSARDRLLAAAGELFYEEGLQAVGIDRVLDRAGVAKASLYSHFGSKDALIRAYLAQRLDQRRERVTQRLASLATPRDKLLGVFDLLAELFADNQYRGCAFLKASVEVSQDSAARAICTGYRGWMKNLFVELATQTGAANPSSLAEQLFMLYDGASMSAQMDKNADAAGTARAMAVALLDAAARPVS